MEWKGNGVKEKKLGKWDEHLAKDKREAYKESLSMRFIEDEIEYKRCRAVTKREVQQKRDMWNTFISSSENNESKP